MPSTSDIGSPRERDPSIALQILARFRPGAIIKIGNNFDFKDAASIIQRIDWLEEGDLVQEILLHIDSDGGNLDASIRLYGRLNRCRIDTVGLVTGRALSAACIILQGCNRRLSDSYSRLGVHEPHYERSGSILPMTTVEDEVRRVQESYPKIIENLEVLKMKAVEILSKNSGQTHDEIRDLMKRLGTILPPELALQMGFIDAIV
jgi:ATP-dependent protease ClpP protease subunit